MNLNNIIAPRLREENERLRTANAALVAALKAERTTNLVTIPCGCQYTPKGHIVMSCERDGYDKPLVLKRRVFDLVR